MMTQAKFRAKRVEPADGLRQQRPAEFGRGAASFTDIITKSGSDQVHGVIFKFVRNAAFDARNFFDRRSIANPGCTRGEPTEVSGSVGVRSPSCTIITYIWAKTSSMNRFPQEQATPYVGSGSGARLSRNRALQSAQGSKIAGSVARMSFADLTQSIPHTGHFIIVDVVACH